jgi:hypothetical protein
MFCNGGTNLWTGVINFQSTGYIGIGTTSPAMPLSIINANGNEELMFASSTATSSIGGYRGIEAHGSAGITGDSVGDLIITPYSPSAVPTGICFGANKWVHKFDGLLRCEID